MNPNTAVNRDAQTAGFAACLGARYLRRWAAMRLNRLALILALLCALEGCTTRPEIPEVAQLQWVIKANPVEDAKKALKAGKRALMAIWGVSWSIPGISEQDKFQYRERYGVNFIEGTGDVLYSEEHAQLVARAAAYAAAYNDYILRHQSDD